MADYPVEGMRDLRLKQAQQSFKAKDYASALVEAEELLDHYPDDFDALMIVGDSSLELGEALGAEAAFCRFLEFRADDPIALSALAIARFELTDMEGSIASADRTLEFLPDHAEALYIRALANEALGNLDLADFGFSQAELLAPDHYPVPRIPADSEWAGIVEAAKSKLHPALKEWLEGIEITVANSPNIEKLREHSPPLSPSSLVLYQGELPDSGEDLWQVKPAKLEIYRKNVSRAGTRENGFVVPIASGLRREALEWIGLSRDAYPFEGQPLSDQF
jgi:tetratricopeptide (TPR) repeat protein